LRIVALRNPVEAFEQFGIVLYHAGDLHLGDMRDGSAAIICGAHTVQRKPEPDDDEERQDAPEAQFSPQFPAICDGHLIHAVSSFSGPAKMMRRFSGSPAITFLCLPLLFVDE